MKYPLNNKALNGGGMPDFGNVELSEFESTLMRLKMRDSMMSEEERRTPDTFGCDGMFLEYFVTPEMEDDFSLIARDFLLHELPNLKDYGMLTYLNTDPEEHYPDEVFERFTLNLMMNAVRHGSTYARNLFLYLHKTYYRKEYQQMKRFQKISADEVMAIATTKSGVSPYSLARILSMARMYGMEIAADCNVLYMLLGEYHNDEPLEGDLDFMDAVFEAYKESIPKVDEFFKDDDEMFDLFERTERYVGNVLRSEGFVEDYAALCDENDDGIRTRLARTLAVLNKTYRNREYSKEELMVYAALYQALSALMCSANAMETRLCDVTFGEEGTDFYDDFPPLFHAEDVSKGRLTETAVPKQTKPVQASNEKTREEPARYNEKALLAEIEELKSKVHQQESEIRQLRGDMADRKRLAEEMRALKEQMDGEHQELVAIRNHLYGMTEADDGSGGMSTEEMADKLAGLRIVIIGGHGNWVAKMRQLFPDWTYVKPSVSGSLDPLIVDRADHVYFFTDIMSHNTYYKYINVVREHKVSFGYIHGVNIEGNVRRMYRELMEKTE